MDEFSLLFLGVAAGALVSFVASLLTTYVSDKTHIGKSTIEVGGVDIQLANSADESAKRILDKVREIQNSRQVYLSYSYLDKEFVNRLTKDLRKLGIRVWLLDEQISVGDSIGAKTFEGISSSQWMILILSENALHSNFIIREFKLALDQEKARNRPFLLPAVIEYVDLPDPLKDRYYSDFRESYIFGLGKLLERVKPSVLDQEVFRKQFLEPENQERLELDEGRRRIEAEESRSEEAWHNELALLMSGDESMAEQLIENERKLFPKESRRQLIQRAIERLLRDRQ